MVADDQSLYINVHTLKACRLILCMSRAIVVDDYSLRMQREEYEEVAFCNPRSEEQEQ